MINFVVAILTVMLQSLLYGKYKAHALMSLKIKHVIQNISFIILILFKMFHLLKIHNNFA